MKKIIVLVMVLILSLSMVSTAIADIIELNNVQEDKNPFFNESEAANIALLFVLNNIENENNWSTKTIIDKAYTLYEANGSITAYSFNLSTNGIYCGYIIVSSNEYGLPIQEFSFNDKPIFEEKLDEEFLNKIKVNDFTESNNIKNGKIIYNSTLDYYLDLDGELYDMNSNKIEKIKEIKKKEFNKNNKDLKEIIEEGNTIYMGSDYVGQDGYVISDLTGFMNDKYGAYSYEAGDYLSNFTGFLQGDYGSTNDCSLMSIATVAFWYYEQGFTNIPSSISDIYDDVLSVGIDNGYTPLNGTPPTKIDNIFEEVFEDWGYSVTSSNNYLWTFNQFKSEIDVNRPALFNLATGAYAEHSVNVFGYLEYDVADFLMVKDNHTTSTRFIYRLAASNEIGSITKMQMN